MTANRTMVEIHILQTMPPSNLNRDDTGSPKKAVYGGVTRARVSSQAWKRPTRPHSPPRPRHRPGDRAEGGAIRPAGRRRHQTGQAPFG